MPEPSGTPEAAPDAGGERTPPPPGDPAPGAGVFTEPERERLVAAFRRGNATATEAELEAFLAWARGVRIEGGMLSLILQGMALPIRPEGGGGYQFRATTEEEQPG